MALETLKALNPFQKAMTPNMFGAAEVKAVPPVNVYTGNNEQNNDFNNSISIFSGGNVSGINPFAPAAPVTKPINSVIPAGFGQNYSNGLAPSSDLQNVYNGMYKGKPNILNQIAIA